jgi:probable rRNA maturation factor
LWLCAPLRGGGNPLLMDLDEIVVTCVSDKRIDKVHRDFMGVAGATDVITFQHGDILISADTAEREARAHGHGISEELLLYIVHGFLHLNGHDDILEADRLLMHAVQDRVWKEVVGRMAG